MHSFFDKNYQTPTWFKEKNFKAKNLSRRSFLKSAAGASAITALPVFSLTVKDKDILTKLTQTDPWLTLDATLLHLLPESASSTEHGPSAKDVNALAYLHQVMTVQPTPVDEKEFILKGVGWLNGFSQSQQGKPFVQLSFDEKESVLRGISNSRAGENWLTTLLAYLFEAMLAPPAYGGNPNGIGWQWLEHQAGFPLPKAGQRYFELPPRARAKNEIAIREINDQQDANSPTNIALVKKMSVKRSSKA
ncbi:MAG: gluconate 2-dehydrogenase subunit 3 family protein [Colwellia sp.]|nr:gluconate 2-dehydrogenase subunit 3 family protein [Colwellia sp.]MCW8866395.1 gluconate 2-dehydrogenase subunit 3 family protein [Colwellia sp.]MCW9082367.1 gluconate 2-dehydrogenase subunit 3 family protein [Colwellia sp.]